MDKRYESRNRNRRLIVSFEMVVDFVAERHATTDGKTISFDSIARFRSNRVEHDFKNGLYNGACDEGRIIMSLFLNLFTSTCQN